MTKIKQYEYWNSMQKKFFLLYKRSVPFFFKSIGHIMTIVLRKFDTHIIQLPIFDFSLSFVFWHRKSIWRHSNHRTHLGPFWFDARNCLRGCEWLVWDACCLPTPAHQPFLLLIVWVLGLLMKRIAEMYVHLALQNLGTMVVFRFDPFCMLRFGEDSDWN